MSTSPLISLTQATASNRYGGKAANLARLLNAGVNSASGLVLGVEVLQEQLTRLQMANPVESIFETLSKAEEPCVQAARIQQTLLESQLSPGLMVALKAVLGDGVIYAVRSSALGEDGTESSFAGQFDSVLDCHSTDAVARAVCRVWASLFGERAVRYALHRRCWPQGMAVVIQQQVDAVVSGVMFTRDPRNSTSNELLVEYCAGLGEQLVSGWVSPGRVRIDRDQSSLVVEVTPDTPVAIDLAKPEIRTALWETALTLEELFEGPQDVEWSLDSAGHLHVLQTRPITAMSESGPGVVWTNANIAENFPEPICPLLRSFVGLGYAAYFRGLGQAFGISKQRLIAMEHALDNLVGCHGGRLYYNLSNIHTVLHLAPGGPWLARFFNQFTGASEFPVPKRIRQSRPRQVMEIFLVAFRVVWRYLYVQQGLKAFEQRVDDYAAASEPGQLANKSPEQLVGLLRGFLAIRLQHWTGAALADTAAMVCYGVLNALLRGQSGVNANNLLKGLPGLASAAPVERLWDLSRELRGDPDLLDLFLNTPAESILARLNGGEFPALYRALKRYFNTWGFRSSGELMLSRPTPREDPLPVIRLLQSYAAFNGKGPAETSRAQAEARENATCEARRRLGLLRRAVFQLVLRATQGAIRLRERARMKQALLYTRLRHVALALGEVLVVRGVLSQPEDLLYLDMDEAIALGEGTDLRATDAQQRVTDRRAELSAYMTLSLPDSFVLPEGESWHAGLAVMSDGIIDVTDVLTGDGACGGHVRGPAAVVMDVTEIDRIQPDQILVTRQTDPGWAAVFFMVKGLVIERGGLLSHGAIIAREYGIPAVVGVRDATVLIGDGQHIFVDGDQGRVGHVRD
ncbi:MAG: hypothetical protein GY814_13655 [Gammaproteobacteria bacterium]|nr:hypothetical protein [Gammaproteobacteria bacterium]